MLTHGKRSQSKGTLAMISGVIYKMRRTCFEGQLGALDTKLGTWWPSLLFLPTSQCLLHALELVFALQISLLQW